MADCTPKQRMLNAYRGIASDCTPVAPEFWYYYPAKVLGVDMITFQREVPFWHALKVTFEKFGTDGWGCTGAGRHNPHVSGTSRTEKVSETQIRSIWETHYQGRTFTGVGMLDKENPSWTVEHPCKTPEDIPVFIEMNLSPDITFSFDRAVKDHEAVGESYLLEFGLGVSFFDFVAGPPGFEEALFYFMSEEPSVLEGYRERFVESQVRLVREACEQTSFEAFFIGNSYSNNSLLGPTLWRRWDKPGLKAVADEVHRHGRLLHYHYHGRCLDTVADLAEIGLDCVCPFERPPGGDVMGREGLTKVRELLGGKVAMNGNVHTVDTLIRGTPETVRAEVREIKEVFAGEPRLIIGTGDQVGRETPEENLYAMIEEARHS